MQKALKNYLAIASGVTEVSKKAAKQAAKNLAGTTGATASQVQALAEDLLSAGLSNRESLVKLVRYEVDRALGLVGLATADEVEHLTGRIHELEKQLRAAESRTPAPARSAEPAPKTAAKKVVVSKPDQLKAEAVQTAAAVKAAAGADQNKPAAASASDVKSVPVATFTSPGSGRPANSGNAVMAPKPAKAKVARKAATTKSPAEAITQVAKATKPSAKVAKGPVKAPAKAPAKKPAVVAPAGAKLPPRKKPAAAKATTP
jgi:polyhydroxyalkanoate synthesis regulator phasin